MLPPHDSVDALDGIDAYSHLWLLFWFHANRFRDQRSTVRPPRLGGNRRLGVFATRSPYRPNPIGLSLVRCLEVVRPPEGVGLRVEGADLIDGTPILDIKPYLPYADVAADARTPETFCQAPLPRLMVRFTEEALEVLRQRPDGARLTGLIEETIALDPRPAYQWAEMSRTYGMRLAGMDVRWRVDGTVATVFALDASGDPPERG